MCNACTIAWPGKTCHSFEELNNTISVIAGQGRYTSILALCPSRPLELLRCNAQGFGSRDGLSGFSECSAAAFHIPPLPREDSSVQRQNQIPICSLQFLQACIIQFCWRSVSMARIAAEMPALLWQQLHGAPVSIDSFLGPHCLRHTVPTASTADCLHLSILAMELIHPDQN